jgi:hypothetical protein
MLGGGDQSQLDWIIVQILQLLFHHPIAHQCLRVRTFLQSLVHALALMCERETRNCHSSQPELLFCHWHRRGLAACWLQALSDRIWEVQLPRGRRAFPSATWERGIRGNESRR